LDGGVGLGSTGIGLMTGAGAGRGLLFTLVTTRAAVMAMKSPKTQPMLPPFFAGCGLGV
jgi:hypothetical protein